MTRRRSWIFCVSLCVLTGIAWWSGDRTRGPAISSGATVLAASGESRWYRGNLHTHSLWSDGDEYPEMIALWYRDRGYDFLCFTDHNTFHRGERWHRIRDDFDSRKSYEKLRLRFPNDWVEERRRDGILEVKLKTLDQVASKLSEPGKFLLIQGEEISDKFEKKPIHLNATNLHEPIPPHGGNSVYEVLQNNTSAVIAQRERTGQPMLVHINHPNFGWAVTAEDLARVRGENFFEVYNGHPLVWNRGNELHASSERQWDIVLTLRLTELNLPLMYGLATDDGHNYHQFTPRSSNPGRGWVMVLADELSPRSLIDSLEHGRFYASSGVTLNKVVSDNEGLALEIAAEPEVEYTVEFIGTRLGFDDMSSPVVDNQGNELNVTRRYSEEIGCVLAKSTGTSARYQFEGNELYVRARVTSSRLHPNPGGPDEYQKAWVQPARGPGAKKIIFRTK